MKLRYAFGLTLAAMAAIGFGQGTLAVGTKAPKLTVSKWVKGNPVNEFKKGNVYVVEFWATWCGPCRESIPHITELAKKYKGKATFVGVSVWESDQKLVAPFVKQMGNKMDYNIAMDKLPTPTSGGETGAMAKNWMAAAGQNGIPASFIIDKEGKVAWIGHPMEMEGALDKVVKGTYATADYEKAKDSQKIALRRAGFDARMNEALAEDNDTAVITLFDEMIADPSDEISLRAGNDKFAFLLAKKRYTEAYATGNQLLDGKFKNSSFALNELAWMIVDPDPKRAPEKRDLDLAMAAAQRSVDLQKGAPNLDTLAWVYFLKGDKAKAIELEKEALALAPEGQKKAFEETLKIFGG